MSLNLILTPGTTPFGTPLPGNAQALVDFMAEYLGITGDEGFNGLNYGPNTPSPENRAYPWFKTNSTFDPIGLYAWNGSDWVASPLITPSGPTGSRPVSPATGTQYFDTTISVQLVWERGAWRTLSGSPGDLKFVTAATVAAAITQNPGWVEYSAARGRVLGAAGAGSGLTERAVAETTGEEDHTLAINELPAHTHSTNWAAYSGQFQNGTQGAGIYPVVTGVGVTPTLAAGGTEGHNNMQPSMFQILLQKS